MSRRQSALDRFYESEKRQAADSDMRVRRALARSEQARPEILYYLASDGAAEVRREIAANPHTPVQADAMLARDPDDEVRVDLARKVSALLPDLTPDEQDQASRRVLEIVEILARDQAVRVRQVVAETLKDVANAPSALIRRLARDVALVVAEPVLRCSPVLSDEDLLEIIGSPSVAGALGAIAMRANVTPSVADAIVAADDEAAVAALLANPSAQIREETLDLIVDQAPARPTWHPGLVTRPTLPQRLARRIATFVASALLGQLEQRADLDPETRKAVSAEVERRLDSDGEARPAEEVETASEIVARLQAKGALDEAVVAAALDEGRRPFVRAALAALSGLSETVVDKILAAHSAKSIVALTWKAGLSPKLATQIQLRIGGVAPKQMLAPRNGDSWPLTPDEMTWHLEFFGA